MAGVRILQLRETSTGLRYRVLPNNECPGEYRRGYTNSVSATSYTADEIAADRLLEDVPPEEAYPQVVCFSPCATYRLVAMGSLGDFHIEQRGRDLMGAERWQVPAAEYDPFDPKDTPTAAQLMFLEVQRLRECLQRIAEVTAKQAEGASG